MAREKNHLLFPRPLLQEIAFFNGMATAKKIIVCEK
jgi:hypothetical protein